MYPLAALPSGEVKLQPRSNGPGLAYAYDEEAQLRNRTRAEAAADQVQLVRNLTQGVDASMLAP